MKKKIISAVCALAVTAAGAGAPIASTGIIPAAITASASSVEFEYRDYKYIVKKDGTVEITAYTGNDGNIEIPAKIDGKNVTGIAEKVFDYNQFVTGVKLPDTLKTIGNRAFYHCDALTAVTFGSGLEEVGELAFGLDNGITDIDLPDGVTTIGKKAFYGTKVKTLDLGKSLTSIGEQAFYNCGDLTSVTIPETVQSIGDKAFSNCGLTTLTVEEGVVDLGTYTFSYCSNLATVSLPDTLTALNGTFLGCTEIQDLKVPANVASIGSETFKGCSFLRTITLPKALTTVSPNAFLDCSSLKNIYFGGTEEDWNNIDIDYSDKGNDPLLKATKHFTDPEPEPEPQPQPQPQPEPQPQPQPAPTKQSLEKAVVKAANGKYTGKAVKPTVSVTLDGKTLKNGVDYYVTFKNNKNCGKASFTVTGKGSYTGSKSGSFIIKPKKVAVKKLTSKKAGTVKLTWKKSAGGVTGYQVQTALNKKFTKSKKTAWVKKPGTTAKTIKGLKNGKKYFARVRAFKKVDGKKYYGAWSKVKTVKCK